MREGIKKIISMRFFVLFMTVVFGWGNVTSVIAKNLTVDYSNSSEFMKKVLVSIEDGQQKQEEVNRDSEQVFELLKQISDDLKKDKAKLFEISELFGDLCILLGTIDEPKRHHIRALKEKIAALDLLVEEKSEDFQDSDEALISKIKTLIVLLKYLLENENLDLGGFGDLLLDIVYHRPIKFVSENNLTVSFLALVATMSCCYWKFKDESDFCCSFKTLKGTSLVSAEESSNEESSNIEVEGENLITKNKIQSSSGLMVRGKKIGGYLLRERTNIRCPGRYKEAAERETFVGGYKLRYRGGLRRPARYQESDDE